jgi:alcohol dehydrogenase class IV
MTLSALTIRAPPGLPHRFLSSSFSIIIIITAGASSDVTMVAIYMNKQEEDKQTPDYC